MCHFQIYDYGLRGGAIVLLLLMAVLLVRDHPRALAARLGATFAVGVASYAICSSHGFAAHVRLWQAPILALCLGNPIVFWLFARTLFDDGFGLRHWHAALWVAPVVLGFADIYILPAQSTAARLIGAVLTVTSLTFAAAAVGQSINGWRSDLVEGRRRLRIFVVGATAAYIAVIGAVELVLQGGPVPLLASVTNAAGLVVMSAVISWSLLRAAGDDLFPSPSPPLGLVAVAADVPPAARPEPDRKLLAELERLMTVERAYRQEGLSIGSLSLKLGIPEYRLRRVINQGLGYRNFAAFLNRYRLEDAKAALVDPTQADVPVLTIAMDAGFQSLPPFNRAFKAETGLTPSEYRRLKVRQAGN